MIKGDYNEDITSEVNDNNNSTKKNNNGVVLRPVLTKVSQRSLIEQMSENVKLVEYKTAFKLFDKDKDNFINRKELGEVMRSLGYELTMTELEDMMNDVGKGSLAGSIEGWTIDLNEFIVLMNKNVKEGDLLDEYIEAFRVFDRAGDGKIKADDLKNILKHFGDDVSEEEIDEMLKDSDVDEEGFVNYKNFVRLLLSK
jgi:calmodulin